MSISTGSDTPDGGRLQEEHVEEMKWDNFYKGLSPEYWWMLAHKVDGENPVTYSKLLLAALKLERQVEARDPLPLRTPTTGSSNVTLSNSEGNLFPSRKLKGNHTFTASSAAVEDRETEEDLVPKPNGENEAKSSAKEDVGTTGEVSNVDPLLGFTEQFANAVELYQKRNHICFGYGSPDYLVKDCPMEMEKTARKVGLNLKEGAVKKGG